MLDIEGMLRRAVANANASARGVCVVLPYDLSAQLCRDLVAENVISTMVVNSASEARTDAWCGGWWIERDVGSLFLRRTKADTLLLPGLAPGHRVSPELLVEARLKGFSRIVTTDRGGAILEDVSTAEPPALPPERYLGGPTYEQAFAHLFALVGTRWRLPAKAFSPRKVLLVTGSLGPGGAERQGAYTAAGLKRDKGYDVHIACNHVDPPADFFRPSIEAHGVVVSRLDQSPPDFDTEDFNTIRNELDTHYHSLAFADIFTEIFRYAVKIREVRPGIVHSWMDYCNVLCGAAATLVGVPNLVLSCRSMAPDHFRIFQAFMRPGYQAILAQRKATLLNNSRAGAADYARWLNLPPEQIQVVHNGFEFPDPATIAARRDDMRAALGLPTDAFVVGSILRFSEEKRPLLLVETARAVHAADPSVRFVIFGKGALWDDAQRYVADHGLEDVILLPGLTEDAWASLAAMDAFLLASRMEGLPNVLIEAQASGVPIVCTAVGGMVETYVEGESGLGVKSATAEDLAATLLAIKNDPELRSAMSARAIAHAREAFGYGRMIQETVAAYEGAKAERNKVRSRA